MKIIKIYNPNAENYKFIEWKLHNVCNYSCSFCGHRSNGGDERWFDIDFYKKTIDKFIAQAETQNKRIWFQITGGEPTLMPDFEEIPKYIKKKGHNVSLLTNGSRTLRWWQEFSKAAELDNILFGVHTQQGADMTHLSEISNYYKDSPTNIFYIVTAPPKEFEKSLESFEFLNSNAIGLIQLRGVTFNNPSGIGYTKDQLDTLNRLTVVRSKKFTEKKFGVVKTPWQTVHAVFDDGHEEIHHGQKFITQGLYKFFGYHCSIGVDYVRIEHSKIWKGNCKQDGIIGDITSQEFGFADSWTRCTQSGCTCSIEWNQPKYLL